MSKKIYHGDLPNTFPEKISSVAIDVEATGLEIFSRDRVCLIQFCTDKNEVFLVKTEENCKPKNIISLLKNKDCVKIFHYARFDLAALYMYTKIMAKNIYCTKIASIIGRTYSNRHGLKTLCLELLGQNICKSAQSSYWGSSELTDAQIQYACNDVLFLHEIKNKLNSILIQEKRIDLLKESLNALISRVKLDIAGYSKVDIFHYNQSSFAY